MSKIKPLWRKMIYTSTAGILLLFILSFNFKSEENLIFKKNLTSLHKLEDIDTALSSFKKRDIYGNKTIVLNAKISAYQANQLISNIEADKCKSQLKNTKIKFIIESCYDELNYGNFKYLKKKPFELLNNSDVKNTTFEDDATTIKRNYNAIIYYLFGLPKQVNYYLSDCYQNSGYYSTSTTDNFRKIINEVPNLDYKYKNTSFIKSLKKDRIDFINDFEYDMNFQTSYNNIKTFK